MTPTPDQTPARRFVTSEERLRALLDITGHLDKAHTLIENLPTWLEEATPGALEALEKAHDESQRAREKARRLLNRVKPLDTFCAEKLTAFLAAKALGDLDIHHDTLEVPKRNLSGVGADLGGLLIETVTRHKYSLLQAAMQNFAAASATADGLPEAAVVRIGAKKQVAPTLSALQFVQYCRELDLGAAYQAHLREVFNLPDLEEGPVDPTRGYNPALAAIGQSRCMDMQIDLHIAYAKRDLDQATYLFLQQLIRADFPAREVTSLLLDGKPLAWHGVSLNEACIWSVLIFSQSLFEGFSRGPFLVYMPNEPVRPWYRYELLEDFKLYLTLKLQVKSYRRFFAGYLDEAERFDFFERFDRSRTLYSVEPLPVTANLSAFFFNAYVTKLQLDTQVLAVPKAQVDEQARQQRLQDYLDAGLTILNVAGLVVPLLGQLMMGVAIGQLLGEVFEGVEDWRHNDRQAALKHLVNVAENLASMALFAAGASVVGRLRQTRADTQRFFDGMEAVRLPDRRSRLWRSREAPYRQALDITGAVASPRGVYQILGQSYVKVDGSLYAIVFDDRIGYWRALHPQRESAFRPFLTHNRQGGWQFTFERPLQWQDPAYLLTRLDPGLAELPAGHLQDIARITEMTVPRLQQLAQENLPLPERFRDCTMRFHFNQRIRDLLWQVEHRSQLDPRTAYTQLLALPTIEGWPRGRFFEVLDHEGQLIERYPETAPFDYEDLSIHITESQLAAGEVMSTTLAALDGEETEQLLGGVFAAQDAPAALRRRLLAALKRNHREVYEKLYQDYDGIDIGDHGLLKRHYPNLPTRVAWEVMTDIPTAQRWRLRHTNRVPLLAAQRVRETLDILYEDQAVMGLHLPELAGEATWRLAMGLFARLPGWPENVFLQLRQVSATGLVLGQAGNETAALKRTVIATAQGFEALPPQVAAPGTVFSGPQGFYQAVIESLEPRQRKRLQLEGSDADVQLRNKVMFKAQDERSQLSSLLWPERATLPEQAPACVQAVRVSELATYPSGLVRQVRKLYPRFDDLRIASFLKGLGPDNLARAKAVEALAQQYEALRRALKLWCSERASLEKLPKPLSDYRWSRLQSAQTIKRCWQSAILMADEYGEQVPSLSLDDMAVGPLPTLPAGVQFDAIKQLSLKRMGLNDDVAYFLKHFKGLHSLELTGNELTRLPEVLSHMPGLQRLYLNDNRLQLTEYMRAKLADMRGLRVLNLSDNPLIDPPQVSRIFELRHLSLSNCRLKELPSGLSRIPYLENVDLRDNDIVELPDWLFTQSRQRAEIINLRHNPLDARSRLLLSNFRDSVGVGMGFLEDDIARLNEQRARELWLAQEWSSRFREKERAWKGLNDEPGSDGLFKLLAELGGTADSMQVREDMDRRVWRVLEAAAGDVQLREEIFERAATPLNCDDAAAVSFSNLEVLVEVHEATLQLQGGPPNARSLLRLGKGLFRLEQLEAMARAHSDEHPLSDPLEVSLAYRTGLVEQFYLPGQPRHMRFSSLGGVTPQALSSAEGQVRAAELSPALMTFLVDLPFWVGYLKRTFSHRFEQVNAPYDERLQALFDQSLTLDDMTYRDQMNEVLREQRLAERAELERLSEEALKHQELVGCGLPSG
ncbi:MAG: NEL-type E3 ubiquitin ligase domain-containing protein [Pseudomonas proteolytica]|uniref:NEL-type E3 ubiquitin ligase domain-containing protein n=1 Tax=Pseudomonas proteolytica TaxID=219574 RepID=UPI003F2E6CCF